MPGAGWSNASSPGFSGAGACWSAGSSILKTFSVSFNSLAYLSSSGNFEIGSSVLIPKLASFCGDLVCELRNRKKLAVAMMRTSEPPHWRGTNLDSLHQLNRGSCRQHLWAGPTLLGAYLDCCSCLGTGSSLSR